MLMVCNSCLLENSLDHELFLWFFQCCSSCQCGLQGALHYNANMAVLPTRQNCWQGGSVCLEHLDYFVKKILVWLSTDCEEDIDDKIGENLVDNLQLCDD